MDQQRGPPAEGFSLAAAEGMSTGRTSVLAGRRGRQRRVATDGRDANLARGPQSVQHSGDTTVRIYPGLMLGLQI
jgi:hypothetical protein